MSYWLIERNRTGLAGDAEWFDGIQMLKHVHGKGPHEWAMRFSRKWDADRMIQCHFASASGYFSSEHMDIENHQPQAPAVEVPSVFDEVIAELSRAMTKFPTWPTDPIHASKVLDEEVGELSKAVLQAVYEPEKNEPGAVKKEALQAAAMAIRFLASLDRYEYLPGNQHEQGALLTSKGDR